MFYKEIIPGELEPLFSTNDTSLGAGDIDWDPISSIVTIYLYVLYVILNISNISRI